MKDNIIFHLLSYQGFFNIYLQFLVCFEKLNNSTRVFLSSKFERKKEI